MRPFLEISLVGGGLHSNTIRLAISIPEELVANLTSGVSGVDRVDIEESEMSGVVRDFAAAAGDFAQDVNRKRLESLGGFEVH